jgi:hypothetical protein
MKRDLILLVLLSASALAVIGAGRGEGGGEGFGRGGRGGGRSRAAAAAPNGGNTIYRQRRVSVPQIAMPQAQHAVRDQSRPTYPQRDAAGARITQRAAISPPSHHAAVVGNAGIVRGVGRMERNETERNHYYWHNDGGIRYSHYYDGHNHWYGFYHGPSFYWTRYYGDRWWWYDGGAGRWDFWGNGYWWWQGPGGTPYVYMDNAYYPYETAGVTVQSAEVQQSPAVVPAADRGSSTVSPDGARLVQLFGSDGQAFLYDKTASPPKYLKFLAAGVTKVRFSGGASGAPLEILVEFKDDTFAVFDAQGNSRSTAVAPATETGGPPPTPDSIPPPPSAAPGQPAQ